jgi:hypothetical protein
MPDTLVFRYKFGDLIENLSNHPSKKINSSGWQPYKNCFFGLPKRELRPMCCKECVQRQGIGIPSQSSIFFINPWYLTNFGISAQPSQQHVLCFCYEIEKFLFLSQVGKM